MFSLKTTEIDIAGPYNTAIGWSNRPATVRHQVAFVHKEKKYPRPCSESSAENYRQSFIVRCIMDNVEKYLFVALVTP